MRRKRIENERCNVVYRIGDKVEIENHGGRSRRDRWVKAEVCEVYPNGMYGELTYSVWRKDTRRIEDYVHTDELRFRNPRDLERRLREDEIVRCQEDLRQLNFEQARQQRKRGMSMRGRRPQRAARAWTQPRAQSVEVNAQLPIAGNPPEHRSMSVPPAGINWAEFLAEFAKVTVCGDNPQEEADGMELKEQNPHFETGMYGRRDGRRGQGQDNDIIDRSERGDWGRRGDIDHRDIIAEVNRGGDHVADRLEFVNNERLYVPNQDAYIDDRRGAYDINLKDHMNRGQLSFNIVLPPGTGMQHGGNM